MQFYDLISFILCYNHFYFVYGGVKMGVEAFSSIN